MELMATTKTLIEASCAECVRGAAETLGIDLVPAHEVGWWCWMFTCDPLKDCRCWEQHGTAVMA